MYKNQTGLNEFVHLASLLVRVEEVAREWYGQHSGCGTRDYLETTWEPLAALLLGSNCRGKWRTKCRIHARGSARPSRSPWPWFVGCASECAKAEGKFWQMHRGALLFSARWRSTLFKVYAGFFMTTLIYTRCMARRYGQITLQLPESEAYYRHIPIRCSCLERCKQPADVARKYFILLI